MKLIIEISEEQYKKIVRAPRCVELSEAINDQNELCNAVKKGVPYNAPDMYKCLLNELTESCAMFKGTYDATNGDESFMYGVEVVMESIAAHVSEEFCTQFSDEFIRNMIDSRRKEN